MSAAQASSARLIAAALATTLAASLLGGCGFQPLYAPSALGAQGTAIGPVFVDEVPGKSGFALQAELDRLFSAERGKGAARRLAITMNETISGLGFRVDESASRSDLTLTASYVFYDPDGTEAFRGQARSVASYDVPNGAFGEISAQDDARERAAEQLAERIRTDISLRLASRRADGPAQTKPPEVPAP